MQVSINRKLNLGYAEFSPRHKLYSFTKRVYATKNPDLVTNIFSFFFLACRFWATMWLEDVVVQRCYVRFEGFKLDFLQLSRWVVFFKIVVMKFVEGIFPASFLRCFFQYITLPETNGSHLKMDGWNMIRFPLGWSIFRCFYSLSVSFGGVADYCIFASPVMGPAFLEGPNDGQSKWRGSHLENWGSWPVVVAKSFYFRPYFSGIYTNWLLFFQPGWFNPLKSYFWGHLMGSYVKDSDECSHFWAYQKGWRNEWIRPQAIFRPKELETQLWNLGGISSFKFFFDFHPDFS